LKPIRVILAIVGLAAQGAARAASGPLVFGLDHAPVAVADLDAAASDFSRLGFVIKPGRPHGDGIRNRHVKFPNGGEIELITASNPTDDLAREYADWLKGGDGPASWSLYSPDLVSVAEFLAARGLDPHNDGDLVTFAQGAMPHRVFFADRLRSPTDSAVYFAHPNTAYRLAGVWVDAAAPELRLLPALGATPSDRARCAPFGRQAVAFDLPGDGDQVVAVPGVERAPERSVIALTVLVRRLSTTRAVLIANHVPFARPRHCGAHSVWIAPAQAHNLWLEFYEPAAGSKG
jgi:hypothetical protein